MVTARLFGQIALSGSVRKKISTALYQEYSQAARQLKRSGVLNGLEAELKVKANKAFPGATAQDYVQLAFKDTQGNVQKLALRPRATNETQTVEQYLRQAIQQARILNGDEIQRGMAKSKEYSAYQKALSKGHKSFQNLPDGASVEFKRSAWTGRKRAEISVPQFNAQGDITGTLTQTLKKARGAQMPKFVNEALEHANLVFENAINPYDLLSARQIQQEAKQVKRTHVQTASKGLKKPWAKTQQQVQALIENPSRSIEEDTQRLLEIGSSYKKAREKVGRVAQRQQQFKYLNRKFDQLAQLAVRSPSRGAAEINLTQEKQKAVTAYHKMQASLDNTIKTTFRQNIARADQQFQQIQAETQTPGLLSRLYDRLPSRAGIQSAFQGLFEYVGG